MEYNNTKQIIIRLSGGLGNQLIQLSAALTIVNGNIDQLVIYDRHLKNYSTKRPNHIKTLFSQVKSKSRIPLFIEKIIRYRINKILDVFPNIITDKNFSRFLNLDLQKKREYYLDGYFQTHIFFSKGLTCVSDLINNISNEHTEFVLKDLNNKGYKKDNTVVIHVRRGDYTNKKVENIYFLQSIEYYRRGICLMQQKLDVKLENIIVFTDAENKEFTFPGFNVLFIKEIYQLTDLEEFILMSKFKNYIIANSTYSFLASTISNNQNKIVIGPYNWSKIENENLMWQENLDYYNYFRV